MLRARVERAELVQCLRPFRSVHARCASGALRSPRRAGCGCFDGKRSRAHQPSLRREGFKEKSMQKEYRPKRRSAHHVAAAPDRGRGKIHRVENRGEMRHPVFLGLRSESAKCRHESARSHAVFDKDAAGKSTYNCLCATLASGSPSRSLRRGARGATCRCARRRRVGVVCRSSVRANFETARKKCGRPTVRSYCRREYERCPS